MLLSTIIIIGTTGIKAITIEIIRIIYVHLTFIYSVSTEINSTETVEYGNLPPSSFACRLCRRAGNKRRNFQKMSLLRKIAFVGEMAVTAVSVLCTYIPCHGFWREGLYVLFTSTAKLTMSSFRRCLPVLLRTLAVCYSVSAHGYHLKKNTENETIARTSGDALYVSAMLSCSLTK